MDRNFWSDKHLGVAWKYLLDYLNRSDLPKGFVGLALSNHLLGFPTPLG